MAWPPFHLGLPGEHPPPLLRLLVGPGLRDKGLSPGEPDHTPTGLRFPSEGLGVQAAPSLCWALCPRAIHLGPAVSPRPVTRPPGAAPACGSGYRRESPQPSQVTSQIAPRGPWLCNPGNWNQQSPRAWPCLGQRSHCALRSGETGGNQDTAPVFCCPRADPCGLRTQPTVTTSGQSRPRGRGPSQARRGLAAALSLQTLLPPWAPPTVLKPSPSSCTHGRRPSPSSLARAQHVFLSRTPCSAKCRRNLMSLRLAHTQRQG